MEIPILCGLGHPIPSLRDVKTFRVYVATWNVGGKPPPNSLNLDDFLQVYDQSDIYVLGNVLVMEDNGSAAKWLSLISQSLNKSPNLTIVSGAQDSLSFQRASSLKKARKNFQVESTRRLKSCNCYNISKLESNKDKTKDSCFNCQQSNNFSEDNDLYDEVDISEFSTPSSFNANTMKYSLIASKQMVGIFVTVWVRMELVHRVGHLRISCISRGIMGCLGNKGCISVSMSIHQTSFCFVCSHLASGQKEGDEHRRNLDVTEILKNTHFPNICKKTNNTRMPHKIMQHDRVIWLGDLNYRIALSSSETRKLVQDNNWDELLNKDQLKIERESGRVFKGWKEGKIYFAPTYKYFYNSDTYTSEIVKSKTKMRTPAWCDRILWHGNGIRQLSYKRRESQFSDHRPVCATFLVDVNVIEGGG
ncbi:hypothetical protein ACSBR2_005121 [Camellia fascicularis]